MEDKNIKMNLAVGVERLDDIIQRLKSEGKSEELISLFDRARDLISVVVLNFKDASLEDIKIVTTLLNFCDNIVNALNIVGISINTNDLYTLIESLEKMFIDKKFLLSDSIGQVSY